ncbi:hypothetical protein D3C72_2076340 [compost metagenome]
MLFALKQADFQHGLIESRDAGEVVKRETLQIVLGGRRHIVRVLGDVDEFRLIIPKSSSCPDKREQFVAIVGDDLDEPVAQVRLDGDDMLERDHFVEPTLSTWQNR